MGRFYFIFSGPPTGGYNSGPQGGGYNSGPPRDGGYSGGRGGGSYGGGGGYDRGAPPSGPPQGHLVFVAGLPQT